MTIIVQDRSGLSPTVIKQAETVATRIYSAIGVRITWRGFGFEKPPAIDQAADVADDESIIRRESTIHVALLSTEMERRVKPDRGTLGIAIAGARLVRIFADRVEFLARGAQQDAGDVLGHVIAHEIGHVLLGLGAHSTAGLMAAKLDLPRIALGGLWFDHRQAAIIRARLAGDGSVRLAASAMGTNCRAYTLSAQVH